MRATLVFVPPGGGEADYQLDFDVPGVPQPGDYITIRRKGEGVATTEDFIVRRSWWHLATPETRPAILDGFAKAGSMTGAVVECEFALGPNSSEDHKRSCKIYEARGKGIKEFDATAS